MSGQPATGAQLTFATGIERVGEFGVPAGSLTALDPILPVAAFAAVTESKSPEINRSGYARAGVPGPRGGPLSLGFPLAPALLLEWLHHMLGSVSKTEPEAGVFQYEFEPVGLASHANTSLWGLVALDPVDRRYWFGGRAGSMVMEIGDNTAIPCRLEGLVCHGTSLGQPEAQPGNVGSYADGPWVRGVLASPAAGDVWVQITRDVAGGGVQFKVEQTPGAPTYPGSAVDVVYNTAGSAQWQNLQGATGLDLGLWDDRNKDPLELVFPGTSVTHADLAVGDEWRMRVSWPTPALATIVAGQRLTSAHWELQVKAVGDPAYQRQRVNSGSVAIEWAVEADRGNEGRYPYDLLRPGELAPKVTFQRSYLDRWFSDLEERHQRLDLKTGFYGPQIGSGTFRESLEAWYPSAGLIKRESAISGPSTIKEQGELLGETDDAGNPPITVTVTTARDWTPPS